MLRDLLLLGHIGFAIIWIGSQIGMHVLAMRVLKASPQRQMDYIDDVEWLGNRLQGPASFMVLIFGVLLVITDPIPAQTLFVIFGVLGWVVVMGIATQYLVRQTKQIRALAGQHGIEAPDVQAKIKTVLRVSWFESILLLLIVFNMIAKPTL
ncbi:hypothetical protein [Actinocrispum wychmicini]|uniref:Uncharacterized protein n=1 Tax=Actinocrispum wychmicini TaxID=1213861 RepID=A0A4V2S4F1_9PSEU|nr:hypothetical protein [Actinocrispum wychmicini]TCO48040.1 hypothetical protein EV192_11693 [Actinocrispum wychmicini]